MQKLSFKKKIWIEPSESDGCSIVEQLKKTRAVSAPFSPPNIYALKNADAFVNMILEAKAKNLKIGIFGDYDADGITSTVMWIKFFEAACIPCCWYVPNRSDGYGPSKDTIQKLIDEGAQMLLFLDCGTNSPELDDVEIPVLILDHHREVRN